MMRFNRDSTAAAPPARVARRLLALAVTLAIPLAALLTSTYQTWAGQISFVEDERAAVHTLRPLRQLLAAELSLAMARASDGSDSSALEQERDRWLAEVTDAPDQAGLAKRTVETRKRLAELGAADAASTTPDQSTPLAAQAVAYFEHVGNASRLVQDPDISTYHLGQSLVASLPTMMDTTTNLAGLAQNAVRVGSYPAEVRTRLVALATILEHQSRVLAKSFGHATGPDGEPAIAHALEHDLVAALAGSARARDIGEKVGRDAALKPSADEVARVVAEAVQAQLALWDNTIVQLDRLLEQRSGELISRQRAGAGVVVIVFVLIGGLLLRTRTDVAARRKAEEALAHQAAHDPLTGLPNRRLFVDRLTHACRRADRAGGFVGVLFVDLDDFKYVNDRFGHDAGDRVLVAVADRVRKTVRATDTPARLGGDEFAVVLEDLRSPEDATRVAQALLLAFDAPVDTTWGLVSLRTSIGVAIRDENDLEGEELLRNADAAMYSAKRHGKGAIATFDAAIDGAASAERILMLDLDGAVERGEMRVEYQPIVELTTGSVQGFEALVRWDHPTAGTISPARFIPFAERTGRIVAIGKLVTERACAQLADWRQRFPELDLFVTINMSSAQLAAPDLVAHLRDVVTRNQLTPDAVVLEFTESAAISRGDDTITTLAELKSLGVRLAIDDFGTGYSSLSYLTRLPVDVLKVDKEFIDRLQQDAGAAALMQKVIELGNSLGFLTVAEGVEEQHQVSALRDFNCSMAQGYLFARPAPPRRIERFLIGQTTSGSAGEDVEVLS